MKKRHLHTTISAALVLSACSMDPVDPNQNSPDMMTPPSSMGSFSPRIWALDPAHKNRTVDPNLADPYNLNAPDFRPKDGSPALDPDQIEAPPQGDTFFEAAPYAGAFSNDEKGNWLDGWAIYSEANVTQPPCDAKPKEILSGTISNDRTLSSDKIWVLDGLVKVDNNATLSIQAGTTVCAEVGKLSFLLVERGAKLKAEGSKNQPIVFTSINPPGVRAPQDWGGIVLKGRAGINPADPGVAMGEGPVGEYGGGKTPNDDDDSGILRYVRIEFAGKIITGNNELNSLTLYAVGRKTVIDYVEAYQCTDDGFEMFGGTVNLKHLAVIGSEDDSFDWEFGWRGKGQFWVTQQKAKDGNSGFESDNNGKNNSELPRSKPTIYNVTLIGLGSTKALAGKRNGLNLRNGTAGHLKNFVVQGFTDVGLLMSEASTAEMAASGELQLRGSIFHQNGVDITDTKIAVPQNIANVK